MPDDPCPHGHRHGLALETRTVGGTIYRRRQCACGRAYVTQETAPPGLRMPPEVRQARRARAARAVHLIRPPALDWRSPGSQADPAEGDDTPR